MLQNRSEFILKLMNLITKKSYSVIFITLTENRPKDTLKKKTDLHFLTKTDSVAFRLNE